jgi:ribosomal protein L3 glutamine methyltransferase
MIHYPRITEELFTIRDWLRFTVSRFEEAGIFFGHGTDNAYDEAVWLIMSALHLPLDTVDNFLDAVITTSERKHLAHLIERRIVDRTPTAYLLREAWLKGYKFYVDERVIVPRSYIAELLQSRMQPWLKPRHSPRAILDLCTGSGCLAIVAAHTFPRAQVDGVDISSPALTVARRNVREHQLTGRLQLIRSDLFNGLAGKRYDLILSNPPYVRESVMRTLPVEYRKEPALALHGGGDGLDLVRRILAEAATHLTPQGWLVLEVGHNRTRVERAFPQLPFIWAETSGGDDCVLLLPRAALAGLPPAPLTPPRKPAARHPRR